ncbi:hypothetical protein DWB61_09910 [Ancylomarina euxinus]|uniref:Uncharacterized protein n=1 Tax=Ancylomarina euxinus TaxID=2283627 RepID=A0A425Y124_9BACT|nr:hypothetical protein [Ancylomarina euxinus]MCZ4693758.1 hypothetical protein [Ancylomarina euxinus]MUP15162.1 hypothetical protein [Ancylomarina euxinus]RRG21585.1 hypothetical protein DWB61_09910 [Ancylomarina euxinus]
MTLSNQNRAAHIKLFYYIVTFVYLSLTVLTVYQDPVHMNFIIAGVFVIYVLLIVLNLAREYNFIIYKETDDKLIMRYYPLHPFHDKFKSIEISKQTFSHFELEKRNLGLREDLYLFQMSAKGLAKYQGISLSALSKEQRAELLGSLSKYSKK